MEVLDVSNATENMNLSVLNEGMAHWNLLRREQRLGRFGGQDAATCFCSAGLTERAEPCLAVS